MKWNNGLNFYESFWQPAAELVAWQETCGVRLDVEACREGYADTVRKREDLETDLELIFGARINWGSPQQLVSLLYDDLGFEVPPITGTSRAIRKADKGQRSTAEASLQWLVGHVDSQYISGVRSLLQWKKLRKLETFFRDLPNYCSPVSHRIHCQLKIGTETGRLTSSNPNLQQQPPEVRRVFVAEPGHKLIAIDYAALEWVVLAHVLAAMFEDNSLVQELVDGVDPHSATAVRMGLCDGPVDNVKQRRPRERDYAKIINYSINYGKTALGLALQIGVSTKKAKEYLDAFYRARPGVKMFHEGIVEYAQRNEFVRSLLGRRRYLNFKVAPWKAKRQAQNVIQACAADIVLAAMLKCGPVCAGGRQILQIHDEILFEAPEEKAQECLDTASELMVNCLYGIKEFKAPLKVTGAVGDTWKEAK